MDWLEVLLLLALLPRVWVESGRDVMEDMVLVRSDGGTMVEAMDMVRDWFGMLPWLMLLGFGGSPAFMWDCGCPSGPGAISEPPDSRLRFGIILPLIVCVCSGTWVYEVMDIVRSSGRSGTTRPWAVVRAMWFMYGCWRKVLACEGCEGPPGVNCGRGFRASDCERYGSEFMAGPGGPGKRLGIGLVKGGCPGGEVLGSNRWGWPYG